MNMFMTASVAGTPIGMLATSGAPVQPTLPPSGYAKPTHGEHETIDGLQCPGDGGTAVVNAELVH